jgi:predicted XRE-type DNA-binding protein
MKKRHNNLRSAEVEEGTGNVFRDLGVKNPDEALMKAKIAFVIGTLIRDLGLTQSAVAAKLGIDQPKVSLILRGRLREFSVERLFRFVSALEQDITITIRPRRRNSTGQRVVVERAA